MGWSIGYDDTWNRDIGYSVTAWCDHPECNEVIDRGLSYVCGSDPYGGENGCGLFFCDIHLSSCNIEEINGRFCEKCCEYLDEYFFDSDYDPLFETFKPKADHPQWIMEKENND